MQKAFSKYIEGAQDAMHKTSLIFSGILFLFGCVTLGVAIICSDILPQIFGIYATLNSGNNYFEIIHFEINSINLYFLAFAELVLGAFGYFYYRKKD